MNRAVSVLPQRAPEVVSSLHEAAERVAPVTLAGERRLEVLSLLDRLFPDGLQRGTSVGVQGPGALSLGLAIAAGPVRVGSWLAAVGCEDLCLVGAEQAGLMLHRMVMVDQPPLSSWGAVVGALVDAFDVVMISGTYTARVRDARRLLSRARERGSVIIDVGGVWPEAYDTLLQAAGQVWSGLGEGHGVLRAREVTVMVSGRRGVRPRQVPLWLPPDTMPWATSSAGAGQSAHAGADIDHLLAVDGSHRRDVEDVHESAERSSAGRSGCDEEFSERRFRAVG